MGRVRGVSHLFGYCFPNRSLTQGLIVDGWHETTYLDLKDKDLTTTEETKEKMLKWKRQYK